MRLNRTFICAPNDTALQRPGKRYSVRGRRLRERDEPLLPLVGDSGRRDGGK